MKPFPDIHHQVHRRKVLPDPSEPFPQKALRAVALDGASNAARRRDAEPGPPKIVFQEEEGEVPGGNLATPIVNPLVFTSLADSVGRPEDLARPHTVSLFRPFRRRRFRTSWPSCVLIRLRNPCVFLRRRLLGWKVRFMLSPGR